VKTLSNDDHRKARGYFEAEFNVFKASNGDDPVGRFTGYYEETLEGSLKRRGKYQTPLYKRPPDLVMADLRDFFDNPNRRRIGGRVDKRGRLKPYETRKQIVEGALAGKGLELVWVADKISAFFLQVQGSGVVQLDGGKTMRIGYAGQNGHVYTAIGREMIADGILTKKTVSMQSIRDWLEANPKKADAMMNRNESYVFFEKLRGTRNGPLGSQGVELTPGRSLAIDRVFIAQSIPIWIDSVAPVPFTDKEETWRRLVVAQDTGGAIRGPVRGDIYWGTGKKAADIAGRTKSKGSYYLLIPKSVSVTAGPQPKKGDNQ
jgi:membrane-bound lytic murein transglycosylase A